MKKTNKIYYTLLLALIFLFTSITYKSVALSDIHIIQDSNNSKSLPLHFRKTTDISTASALGSLDTKGLDKLNISGSGQFTEFNLPFLKEAIDDSFSIIDIDLRQESHGFINDLAISFYSIGKDLNNGFTTEETVSTEDKLLNSIKQNSQISIYDKLGKVLTNITVDSVSTENNAINKNGLKYQRFAVKDGGIPSATVIDDFVDFIKNKPEGQHLHFHCDAGEGRTTTFMVLYQIMTDNGNLSLDQILCYQYNMGGITLTDDVDRAYFLNAFYNYVEKNKTDNYSIKFSQWIKQ